MPKQYPIEFPPDPPLSHWALMRSDPSGRDQLNCALYHYDTYFNAKWCYWIGMTDDDTREMFGDVVLAALRKIGENDMLFIQPGAASVLGSKYHDG